MSTGVVPSSDPDSVEIFLSSNAGFGSAVLRFADLRLPAEGFDLAVAFTRLLLLVALFRFEVFFAGDFAGADFETEGFLPLDFALLFAEVAGFLALFDLPEETAFFTAVDFLLVLVFDRVLAPEAEPFLMGLVDGFFRTFVPVFVFNFELAISSEFRPMCAS